MGRGEETTVCSPPSANPVADIGTSFIKSLSHCAPEGPHPGLPVHPDTCFPPKCNTLGIIYISIPGFKVERKRMPPRSTQVSTIMAELIPEQLHLQL